MRYLSADFIFSAHSGFTPDGILVLDDSGKVIDLLPADQAGSLLAVEKFKGILCPGFINAHCHLELSHLRGQISKHTGFVGFAKELIPKRGTFSAEEIAAAIEDAEKEMYRNGIAGVGDISNGPDSFAQKAKGKLRYHTFIELLALNPGMAEKVVEAGTLLKKNCPQTSSLAPHAPYTVSTELLELIGNSAHGEKFPLTMHNQESAAENEFFIQRKGLVLELYSFLGIDISYFKPTGTNALRSRLKSLPPDRNILLVHNTFTSEEDLRWAEFYSRNLYWCFCPNANLYIENRLPDFKIFTDAKVKTVLGTDSLASNDSLSVLDEMKIIAKQMPEIPLEQLLIWATKNGAEALRFSELGSFEKGKKPGVNLITNYGLQITGDALLGMSSSAQVTRIC